MDSRKFGFAVALLLYLVTAVCPRDLRAEDAEAARGGSTGQPASKAAERLHAAISSMDLRIKLPFLEGEKYELFQGNHGSFSHSGLNQYAWDFGLPEGTPVVAAAAGRVVRVKQDSGRGGTTSDFFAHGNTVILDHGHGLFTQYLHLKKSSARVREGEMVEAGQILALSGNTGFSSVPHLHFQVQNALGQSLPCRFVDVPGDGVPVPGQVCVSANDGRGTSPYAGESVLPDDVFAQNGIWLEKPEVPAHLLRTDEKYRISGRTRASAQKVAVYLMSPRGGRPVQTVFCSVDEKGFFSGTLSLEDLPRRDGWSSDRSQSNPFALAVAPVAEDGSFWSSFSVPVTAR